jgi:hypothetical protein
MPIFLERFVLPLLAAIVVIVAIINPVGLELRQRVIGTTALLLLAGVAAYLVHRHNQRRFATTLGQTQRPLSTPEPISYSVAQTSPAIVVKTAGRECVFRSIEGAIIRPLRRRRWKRRGSSVVNTLRLLVLQKAERWLSPAHVLPKPSDVFERVGRVNGFLDPATTVVVSLQQQYHVLDILS